MEERGEAGGGGERWEGEGRGEKREREGREGGRQDYWQVRCVSFLGLYGTSDNQKM